MRGSDVGILVLLAGALAACGGGQLNQQKLSSAEGAIRAAEEVGANDQPKAALHLQLARDQINQAKRIADDGDEENAALLLNRAQADADLALQLANTDQEQQEARQAWQKIQDLKQEQQR